MMIDTALMLVLVATVAVWGQRQRPPVRPDRLRRWLRRGPAARASETRQFLLDAARGLASSPSLEETLARTTALLVPRFADCCVIFLRAPDGSLREASGSPHEEPTKFALLRELQRHHEPDPRNAPYTIVLDRHTALSCVAIPLMARGQSIGTIALLSSGPGRRHAERELASLELIGGRAALAIDNALLLRAAEEAHGRAVRATDLETQLAQARLEALRAQLNPHLLFNCLNTIAMLVRRKANDGALRGVIGLSELLREVLTHHPQSRVPLSAELQVIGHYLDLERLRYRDALEAHMTVAPDALHALVPSLILQPIVENAVRHGLDRRRGARRVVIAARREADRLVLEVHDDGPGFAEGFDPASGSGIGLVNTRERLAAAYGPAHTLELCNAPGTGAIVRIGIPFLTS